MNNQATPAGDSQRQYSDDALEQFSDTLLFLNTASAWGRATPDLDAIANALLPQLPGAEQARLRPIILATDARSATNARPGLRALTKLVTADSVTNLNSFDERSTLRPSEQVITEVRARTNTPLAALCAEIWNHLAPYFASGTLVFPAQFANLSPRLSEIGKRKEGCDLFGEDTPVWEVTIDARLAALAGAVDAKQTMIFIHQLMETFTHVALPSVLSQIDCTAENSRKLRLLDLRGGIEKVILAGFGQGFAVTAYSMFALYALASRDPGITITPQISRAMAQEHAKFVLPHASWNLLSFAALADIVEGEPERDAVDFFCRWAAAGAVSAKPPSDEIYRRRFLRPECFKHHPLAIEGIGDVPILDYSLEGFSQDQLRQLATPATSFGCPATPLLPEFVGHICRFLENSVFAPFFGSKD